MSQSNSGELGNIGDKTYEHIYGIDKIDIPEVDDNDSDIFEVSYKNMDFNDMDFEQTYTMYSTLQQKKALNVMDQLQKVQMFKRAILYWDWPVRTGGRYERRIRPRVVEDDGVTAQRRF